MATTGLVVPWWVVAGVGTAMVVWVAVTTVGPAARWHVPGAAAAGALTYRPRDAAQGPPMTDRFRLTIAQLNATVGDLEGNAARAREAGALVADICTPMLKAGRRVLVQPFEAVRERVKAAA